MTSFKFNFPANFHVLSRQPGDFDIGHIVLGTLELTTMSLSKKLTAQRIDDIVLGAFSLVPTSETLDHAIRYLSTWSGSEYVEHILKTFFRF